MIALVAAATISIVGAWSRPAVDQGVVYATIRNASAQRAVVVGASSPVARTVELHESTATMQGGSMNGTTMRGMETMSMRPVSKLPIPPHGAVALKPGGYHLMLIGLRRPLAAGQRFPIVVRFADGTRATATVDVENRAF